MTDFDVQFWSCDHRDQEEDYCPEIVEAYNAIPDGWTQDDGGYQACPNHSKDN
jgi:hypothetical protein